ncbi:putative U-box domain-containing protein 53 isoform X2 [Stylophora pistillata]|uniref:putative U-box domain-containing protein 53 isoform X2 n=1 Tax=Stylophora pistillata TaxID=50429 RepID=UPI000C055CBE|nr:putative U-box domain-containing protein 53 isoform X2 [Stylophora pistillata]
MEEPSVKYILLRDRIVERIVDKMCFSLGLKKFEPMKVLRGELLEGVPEAEQPTDLPKVAVVGIERKSLRLECRMEDMTRLSEEEANFLLAISSLEERYQTSIVKKRLAFGRQLFPGCAVFVKVERISKVLPGVVWYKGELPPNLGTWFGVEILDERLGTGCGKRMGFLKFVCKRDYALFVPVETVIPEKYFDENLEQATGQEAQEQSEQINEEELDVISLDFESVPTGTSKESVRKLRRTNSMTSAEIKIMVAAGESSKTDSQEFIEKQRLMLREFVRHKSLPDHQDNYVIIQDEEGKDSAENSHFKGGHFQSIPPDDCGQTGTSRRKTLGKQQQSQDLGSQLSSLREKPRDDNEPEKSLLHRLREMEQQVTQLRAELQGKESEKASLLREKQEQHDRLQKQLQEKHDQLVTFEAQVRKMEEQLTNVQGQLQTNHDLLEKSDALVRKKEEQVTFLQSQLLKKDGLLVNSGVQVRETTQQLTNVKGQLQEKDEEIAGLKNQVTIFERRLMTKNQEVIELEMSLSAAQQLALSERQRQESPDWVIIRDQIQLTNKCLGRGAWGSVVEGKYCGCAVAVKQIHDLILSPYNRRLFEREMDIASRCRHPCLLQFIGATNDEENPLFVTELMETSLRALIEQKSLARQPLSATDRSVISLDVARALNYLHQKQPSPIIHRDVSSANVLLWLQGDQWRAKVSDYGTANFKQQTMTAAPGAAIYSAPEALSKDQTVMVDVYSFGVLLCEMSIQEMPDPERREQQVALVTNRLTRALIRGCLKTQPEARPTMEEIIDELEQPV